jgi:hypothetical protein
MKRLNQSALGLLLVAVSANACSNSAPAVVVGTGGASVGTGGATAASGGATGSGSGGATLGSGGAFASGGSTGSGGADSSTDAGAASGGSTGTGGAAGGSSSGGSSAGGGLGTGGGAQGTGGATQGTGGSSAGGDSGGDLLSIVGAWDGALDLFPCSSLSNDGYDCPNACPAGSNGKTTMFAYPIGGTAGTIYNVTLEAKGIVEVYAYVNTDRGMDSPNIKGNGALNNLFSIGGTQQPAGNGNDYNTYELDVSPAVAGLTNVAGTAPNQYNVYYLNSVTQAENPHIGGGPTQHLTFSIDDLATIKVPGKGTVTLKSFDSNCVEVQNCGVTSGNTCTTPQSVSLAGAMPAPPASFMQPYVDAVHGHGQFVFFDIKDVTVAQ